MKGRKHSMQKNINQNIGNTKEEKGQNQVPGKKVTSKQVVAIIGVVLLVLMYIVTLFAAVFDSSASGRLFWMCLFSTVAIPILIWIYTWMYGVLTKKHTIADFDLGGRPEHTSDEVRDHSSDYTADTTEAPEE